MKSGLVTIQLEVDAMIRYIKDKPDISVNELKQEIGQLSLYLNQVSAIIADGKKRIDMWKTKCFKTQEERDQWIEENGNRYQWEIVFINNGYAVEYRKLRKVY